MFAAHGIPAVVGAENHAGMLGGLGGAFLSLDLWVDGEDQEEAEALLRDFREREGSGDDDDDDDDDDDVYDGNYASDDPGTPDSRDADDDAAGTYTARYANAAADTSAARHANDDAGTSAAHHANDDAGTSAARHANDDAGTSAARNAGPDAADSVRVRTDRRRRTGIVLLLGCLVTFGTAHMFTRAWRRGFALAAIQALGFVQTVQGHALGGMFFGGAILTDLIGALWRVRTAPRSRLPAARVRDS
jgi:hypothetical protein